MSWRTFRFFDFEELKDPDTNQPFDKLKVENGRLPVVLYFQLIPTISLEFFGFFTLHNCRIWE